MDIFLLAQQTSMPEDMNFGALAFRMLLYLGLVIVLIYFVLPRILRFFVRLPTHQNRTVRILERVPVDQKRNLLVVEVQGKVYLFGSAEGQINVLMELDREKMNLQDPAPIRSKGFEDVLRKTFLKPKSPEVPDKA